MNQVSVADYVPPPVVQDVVVLGSTRGLPQGAATLDGAPAAAALDAAPAAAAPQVEVLNASLASTGTGLDLALVLGAGALVLVLGILLVVLGARVLRTR